MEEFDGSGSVVLFEADGLGAGEAVQIAHFDTPVNLTTTHFEISA